MLLFLWKDFKKLKGTNLFLVTILCLLHATNRFFCYEKASVSHNHVCCENIYVTESGSWKLGGFEHACRFSEFSKETIQNIHQATSIVLPEEKVTGGFMLVHLSRNYASAHALA